MEEFENEKNELENEQEDGCKCGGHCKCNHGDPVLGLILLTNTITSLALAVVAIILVCKLFFPPKPVFDDFGRRPRHEFRGDFRKDFDYGKHERFGQKRENMEKVKPIFDNNYKTYNEAKKEGKTMLVLFYADWCPHCQTFAPTFKKLSKDKDLKKVYNFVTVDTRNQENLELMSEFGIQGIPALFLVEPKTNKKVFIPSGLLFGPNPAKELKDTISKIQ